jgi:hypothetical protein
MTLGTEVSVINATHHIYIMMFYCMITPFARIDDLIAQRGRSKVEQSKPNLESSCFSLLPT